MLVQTVLQQESPHLLIKRLRDTCIILRPDRTGREASTYGMGDKIQSTSPIYKDSGSIVVTLLVQPIGKHALQQYG